VDVYGYCLDDPINLVDPMGLEGIATSKEPAGEEGKTRVAEGRAVAEESIKHAPKGVGSLPPQDNPIVRPCYVPEPIDGLKDSLARAVTPKSGTTIFDYANHYTPQPPIIKMFEWGLKRDLNGDGMIYLPADAEKYEKQGESTKVK